jgi:hypothetical protein
MASSSLFADDSPSFSRDIAPIFMSRCVACHLTGEEAGEIAIYQKVAWRNLVNVPSIESDLMRIKPGDPAQSYLMLKLDGEHLDAGGSGSRMPSNGEQLSQEVREQIRSWIREGALDN